MNNITLSDCATIVLVLVGALTLILSALVCYLINVLARVEITLWRMHRLLRAPAVPRDHNGDPLRERI